MAAAIGAAIKLEKASLIAARFDKDDDGLLTKDELLQLIREAQPALGRKAASRQCDRVMAFADGRARLSVQELARAYGRGVLDVDKHLAALRLRPLDALEKRKAAAIFAHFAPAGAAHVSMPDLRRLMQAVSPAVQFEDRQMAAITAVLENKYPQFITSDGITLRGFEQTYANGAGDVHRDFATLGLSLDTPHATPDGAHSSGSPAAPTTPEAGGGGGGGGGSPRVELTETQSLEPIASVLSTGVATSHPLRDVRGSTRTRSQSGWTTASRASHHSGDAPYTEAALADGQGSAVSSRRASAAAGRGAASRAGETSAPSAGAALPTTIEPPEGARNSVVQFSDKQEEETARREASEQGTRDISDTLCLSYRMPQTAPPTMRRDALSQQVLEAGEEDGADLCDASDTLHLSYRMPQTAPPTMRRSALPQEVKGGQRSGVATASGTLAGTVKTSAPPPRDKAASGGAAAEATASSPRDGKRKLAARSGAGATAVAGAAAAARSVDLRQTRSRTDDDGVAGSAAAATAGGLNRDVPSAAEGAVADGQAALASDLAAQSYDEAGVTGVFATPKTSLDDTVSGPLGLVGANDAKHPAGNESAPTAAAIEAAPPSAQGAATDMTNGSSGTAVRGLLAQATEAAKQAAASTDKEQQRACWDASRAAAERVLEIEPKHSQAHFLKGSATVSMIDENDAEGAKAAACVAAQQAFSQALVAAEPGAATARVLLNLGVAFELNGQMFRATECYQDAVALVPASPRAQKLLGSALLHLGRCDEAASALRTAATAAGGAVELRADALCDLGNVLASQGKYAEAITAFTAAVEAVPADTLHTAHFNLANAHRKLAAATRTDAEGRDHYRHAVVAYTALVQAEPTNWRARVNLGATHLAAGDAKLATRTLRPALALAQRIDVYDVLKGAKRIARGRAGRLRRLLVPGYTPSRLAGAAAAGDRRRFAKAGYVCEDLLDQVNLAFLAQLTPMLRQDAFSTHGLLGVAAAANESGLRGAASRARVEALLRGMLSAMPAERFAACMRALSDGLLCHVATAALAGGKGGDSDDLDLGMLLAALSLLAREPGEATLDAAWTVLMWRAGTAESGDVPEADLVAFFAVLRAAFGAGGAGAAQGAAVPPAEARRCGRAWFGETIQDRRAGFKPCLALNLMARRRGWVF